MAPPYIIFVFLLVVSKFFSSNGKQCSFNSMCSCKSSDAIPHPKADSEFSCIGIPFSKLPDLPHGNMSHIAIVGSGLEVLTADSLGDMKAKTLSLTSNKIVSIHDHSFMGMYRTLEELDLSFNNLQDIPIEAILSLQKLKVLNIESNDISNLRVTWKHMKDSLESLYLSGNDLSTLPLVPDYSLSSFQGVKQIYFDRNSLSSIETNALPYNLHLLSASDNSLTEIPIKVIDALPKLSKLYLKNNYIASVPNIQFSSKKTLVALDLSQNLLTTLNGFFDKSVIIKDLNLGSNYINSVGALTFNGLACEKIDLSDNDISTLPERAFYGVEYTLEHLDLGHNKLTKIPKALLALKHIKVLILDYNDFPDDYPDNFLKNFSQSLRSLSLAGNKMKHFPKNIFKSTKKISYLNLGYNLIEEISENDFLKWSDHLETLILMGNSITKLNAGTFKHLKNLIELNLSFNKVAKLDDKTFINLDKLKNLDLCNSLRTTEFPDIALKPLNSLMYLALSSNNITTLPRTGIYDLPNLNFLILDFNRISEIPENFFHTKVHKVLADIRMSYNQLTSIDTNTFNGLEGLKYVVLNDNHLTFISQGAFKNLPNIITIILSNNQIDKITPMSFVNIPNLFQLDLSSNNLQEFSFNIFLNVTNELQPMALNLSYNKIENVYAGEFTASIYVKVLDLSNNKLIQVPQNVMITVKGSLRKLDLGFNQIRFISANEFHHNRGLEVLNLKNNGLLTLKPASFHGLHNLQILDLSHNHIELLNLGQFKNMQNLRILDLSHNLLRSLPNDAFHNTKLERLIVNNNVFVLLPATPFVDVGYTLRVIDFSNNQIEQVGREVFSSMPLINEVNLCHNKLTNVHSNDFKSITPLINLQLCGNKLNVINKDLFHHTPNLRYLSLADTNLKQVPLLHILNLVSLNLSHNLLSHLSEAFLEGLPKLKYLDLSHNNLTILSGISWIHSPNLKSVDLSNNPLKILTKDSFNGLLNLQYLNIQNLPHLERFDSDTLTKCQLLKSLKIQTWPKIEKYRFRLARILLNLKQLKNLSVKIIEESLSDQLQQAFPKKLQYLEITGEHLKKIGENSLEGVAFFKEFHLRISGTSIENFPKNVFWKIKNNRFTLDLSSNQIYDIDPEVFYEKGGYRRHGTQVYPGNINVLGNPIACGCNTIWFSKWMRRYLIESMKINGNKPEFNQQLKQDLKQTVCYTYDNKLKPILAYDKEGCKDVLSAALTHKPTKTFIIVLEISGIILAYLVNYIL